MGLLVMLNVVVRTEIEKAAAKGQDSTKAVNGSNLQYQSWKLGWEVSYYIHFCNMKWLMLVC